MFNSNVIFVPATIFYNYAPNYQQLEVQQFQSLYIHQCNQLLQQQLNLQLQIQQHSVLGLLHGEGTNSYRDDIKENFQQNNNVVNSGNSYTKDGKIGRVHNFYEEEFAFQLKKFLIDPKALRNYGFPVKSSLYLGCVEIVKSVPKTNTVRMRRHQMLTQGSVDSSQSRNVASQYDHSLEKQCVRCNSTFHVTETGEYLNYEQCTFHWGKLSKVYTGDKGYCYQYTCCMGFQESQGCMYHGLHVWSGVVAGLNGPYTDFVHTKPRYDSDGSSKVYALDCEMSFTGRGLELTKITVVGYDGQLVYEHFVRPNADIVDYNTRFSGITENDLCPNSNNSVKSLNEVQSDLLELFDADTILIGHGLENDLRVLRIVHKKIIDTSICFPHASGSPYRRSLKHLTKTYLNRDIQSCGTGHNSFEDSRACLELMLWKVRNEMRCA